MHSFRCPILFLVSFFWSAVQVQAQTFPAGELCGCPEVSQRDTVWVTDNDGAGVGSATWTCDHLYVLTEQVFVNAADTLTMEPGTVVLGMAGEGRSELDVPVNFGVGSVRDVTYDVYPGALVVSRGAYLDAQGTSSCPIQMSFLGDPMDGSVGLDVTGQWGGLALCGAGQTNTLHLDLSFFGAPFFTTGVGTGEDRIEGIVDLSGQDREVYGSNEDPTGSSGVLRHMSIRHGSTNLGWTQFGNGNETDLLQLGACGSGTVVEFIELLSSADDGLHILGGMVEVRHIVSAFHAEDAFESDQGWQGSAQYLLGIQDTTLAQATNPPGPSFVYDAEGDDVQDNNMDPSSEPYCTGHGQLHVHHQWCPASGDYHSLPGGDWVNSVVHGVSDAGVEIQHYLTCDGFNAMLASQYGFLSLRNWRIWGDASQGGDVLRGRYQGNYGAQAALEGWLTDSTNVIEQVLVDGAFELSNGTVVDGLTLVPRPPARSIRITCRPTTGWSQRCSTGHWIQRLRCGSKGGPPLPAWAWSRLRRRKKAMERDAPTRWRVISTVPPPKTTAHVNSPRALGARTCGRAITTPQRCWTTALASAKRVEDAPSFLRATTTLRRPKTTALAPTKNAQDARSRTHPITTPQP